MSRLTPPGRRLLRLLAILCAVSGALVASQLLRTRLGVEWSPEAVRATVSAWGWWAPAAYLVLMLLRPDHRVEVVSTMVLAILVVCSGLLITRRRAREGQGGAALRRAQG